MKTDRRFFLKTLGMLAGAGVLVDEAGQASARTEMLLNVFSVAGFQYHEGREVLADIRKGQLLDMRPEPENVHDAFAVALFWRGRKLGYIPRSDNRHISRLLQQGGELAARVLDVDGCAPAWNAVRVAVSLRG